MNSILKNKLYIIVLIVFSLLYVGCKDDDPEPINPEELITTLTLTLTPHGGGAPVVFQFKDLDGDGGNPPEITNGVLADSTMYHAVITLLNESVSPAEDISEEVEEEGTEHQFFFQTSAGLDLTFDYTDMDDDGKPIGLMTNASTGGTGTGALTITLRHEPDKNAAGVVDGDISNAGGETDIEVTFDVEIE